MTASVSLQQAFRQAIQHHQAGQLREAESIYRQVLSQQPDHADALHMLGILGHQIGRSADAVELLRRAVAINPQAPEYHANLGAVLASLRQPEAAAVEFGQALAFHPDSPETQHNLGKVLKELERFDEAIEAFNQVVVQRPNLAEAHNQLGDLLRDTGQLDEALASYRRAMALSPDPRWGSSLVYALHLHPDYGPKRIDEAHRRWGQTHAEPLGSAVPVHRNDPSPDRRLRIGYVSAGFRDTPRSHQILPLLTSHDRGKFEIVCYSNTPAADHVTDRFRGHCDVWRDIAAMSDQQAMDLVVQDQIDVLVDLSMHGQSNRLLLFARKPAPVQVTGLAYPGTTGLITMDYRLSDPPLEPEAGQGSGQAGYGAEEVLRLPDTLFCFEASAAAPSVNDLPATDNGFLTFGCLNEFAVVTGRTIELWSKVLRQVERSRLLLGAPRGSARQRTLTKLQECGIEPDRVELVDQTAARVDPSLHHRIDLILDTFPWNGSVSTFEALWMGVPVVTLTGGTGVSRIGKSILTNLGLTQFVAHDEEGFVVAAAGAAGNLPALAELRASLRQRLMSSTFMDASRFARNVEDAYRRAWRTWCETQSSAVRTLGSKK